MSASTRIAGLGVHLPEQARATTETERRLRAEKPRHAPGDRSHLPHDGAGHPQRFTDGVIPMLRHRQQPVLFPRVEQ